VTPALTPKEIGTNYEKNTGLAICRYFRDCDPDVIPAVLIASHGPFCWGRTPAAAAHNAVILEAIARMAYYTVTIADVRPIARELHDKNFLREHGRESYYGQGKAK
jgi:L-ribulose-5-phosphate 4-epimerase